MPSAPPQPNTHSHPEPPSHPIDIYIYIYIHLTLLPHFWSPLIKLHIWHLSFLPSTTSPPQTPHPPPPPGHTQSLLSLAPANTFHIEKEGN